MQGEEWVFIARAHDIAHEFREGHNKVNEYDVCRAIFFRL